MVIDKALKEEDPEKKMAFANSIAYYMKLSYSNWHKELVHDDSIRSELNTITGGELEFSNTPFIKHRNQNFEREEFGGRNNNNRRQNFGNRNGNGNNNGRSNNNGGGNRMNNNRNNNGPRDNRNGGNNGGSQGGRPNNNNRNFKKRF